MFGHSYIGIPVSRLSHCHIATQSGLLLRAVPLIGSHETSQPLCYIPNMCAVESETHATRHPAPEAAVALEALRCEVTVEELHHQLREHGALGRVTTSAGPQS